MKVGIRWRALLLYGFGLLVAYLAGMSFGGVLAFLFYFMFFFPLLSCVSTVYGSLSLRYYEDFSLEHPAKGDTVRYRLTFSTEARVVSIPFRVKFSLVYAGMTGGMNDFTAVLKPGESLRKEYQISCPWRGIYTVGIDSLSIEDPAGWLTLHPAVWNRTFYVYPRIIRLAMLPGGIEQSLGAAGTLHGQTDDYTLLRSLDDYRPGTPVRHIAWKKFTSSGVPFIKTYEKSALPGLDICVDLRRAGEPDEHTFGIEDCTIEILVAIVSYLLERNVPVNVFGMGGMRYRFAGKDRGHFGEFYKTTINITFGGDTSPARFVRSECSAGAAGSLLFVTHTPDPESFDLMTMRVRGGGSVMTICNASGRTVDEVNEILRFIGSAREHGAKVFPVRNAETIREDLERT